MHDDNDNIWFTYKARIQACNRLEWWDLHSQLLLVWYAILGVTLAIISIQYPEVLGKNTSIYASIMSVALLVISLVISNRDFRGRSLKMRENYLALQALYNSCSLIDNSEVVNKYFYLLKDIENHNGLDDKKFRVFAHGLKNRKPNIVEIIHVYAAIIFRMLCCIFFYIVPFSIFLLDI
ncbi:SLATT domain-containing protein [Proteus columbae]|uniref:SLATT domain-containing protein n=1 Tax=Proteus columbae TaxID=1987580 RepID=UPI00288A00F8|nr:SLATT domain-containing protein [Proteus columbae]